MVAHWDAKSQCLRLFPYVSLPVSFMWTEGLEATGWYFGEESIAKSEIFAGGIHTIFNFGSQQYFIVKQKCRIYASRRLECVETLFCMSSCKQCQAQNGGSDLWYDNSLIPVQCQKPHPSAAPTVSPQCSIPMHFSSPHHSEKNTWLWSFSAVAQTYCIKKSFPTFCSSPTFCFKVAFFVK